MPVFRADFGWLDGYVFRPEPPLELAVTAFAGTGDTAVGPAVMAGWRNHGTGPFTQHCVAGGHFFVHDRLSEISGLIRADLAGDVAGGAGGGSPYERRSRGTIFGAAVPEADSWVRSRSARSACAFSANSASGKRPLQ